MRWTLGFVSPLTLGAVALAGGAPGAATALSIAEPTFRDAEVVVATSMPPQFEIAFVRDMPSPGWSFTVDAVEVDEAAGRVRARISEVPPTGPTAQMISATTCRLPLGRLTRGAYTLELWLRPGGAKTHVLTQALVVHAR